MPHAINRNERICHTARENRVPSSGIAGWHMSCVSAFASTRHIPDNPVPSPATAFR